MRNIKFGNLRVVGLDDVGGFGTGANLSTAAFSRIFDARYDPSLERVGAAGISVEVEHLLIEQTGLIRIAGPAAGCLPARKLL
jgi:hypothetical protein